VVLFGWEKASDEAQVLNLRVSSVKIVKNLMGGLKNHPILNDAVSRL
jgi:hypothetical protein